jgi:hypothetical protein
VLRPRRRVPPIGPNYDQNVFINCPFDDEYAAIFEAIVFAVQDFGFRPRCARERLDSGEMRLAKIVELIAASRYSIHDLSRTELDSATALPRFNMPFELGIDLGCRIFGRSHAKKSILIFDSGQYRYRTYISDISGLDIHQHGSIPARAVARIRHWLRDTSGVSLRAGSATFDRYVHFREDLPNICAELRLDIQDLSFADFSFTIAAWLREHQ